MAVPANPGAMAPRRPGKTRTAPPMRPDGFPSAPRYRNYLLFDATGLTYLLVGFVVLRVAWALGSGPEAWTSMLEDLRNPLYVGFHVLVLLSVLFVGVRFFRLFPKAQPAKLGPAKPPPPPVLHGMLYAAWVGLTVALVAILGGFLFLKTVLLRLEPVIWLLFGAGIMLGTLLLPGYLLTVGIGGPLGFFPADALSYERLEGMLAHPIGGILFRLVLLALVALPLWKGAHHLRALSVDFDGHHRDGAVASILYLVAIVGSVLGIYAVFFRL